MDTKCSSDFPSASNLGSNSQATWCFARANLVIVCLCVKQGQAHQEMSELVTDMEEN